MAVMTSGVSEVRVIAHSDYADLCLICQQNGAPAPCFACIFPRFIFSWPYVCMCAVHTDPRTHTYA